MISNNWELELSAFRGEELLIKQRGSLSENKLLATMLDAESFIIKDPANPSVVMIGERESSEDIDWKEHKLH